MKTRLLTFAASLALVAVLGHFYAKPLLAQVKAALVRDIDNPARNAIQIYLDNNNTFHVRDGKILVIEDVAFETPYNIPGTFGIVTSVKGLQLPHYFSPGNYVSRGIPTGGSFFGGRTTRLYADPNTDVFLQSAGATLSGYCVLSGYLLDVSN